MPNIDISTPFLLYSNCILISGYKRSSIIDLHQNKQYLISNPIAEIIRIFEGKSISKIYSHYTNREAVNQYFEYLLFHDLIFFTNQVDCFPKIDFSYKSASIISNAIFEYGNAIDFKKIITYIDELNCKSVAIFFNSSLQFSSLVQLLDFFKQTVIGHIEFYLSTEFDRDSLINLFFQESRLQKIIVSNQIKNEYVEIKNGSGREIIYLTKSININHGLSSRIFSINVKTVAEATKFHTYFNQKLFVNSKGIIKNAPECKEEFGNIKDISNINELYEIINSSAFNKFWHANKDNCDICLDCEYRYICIDNRLPLLKVDEIWFHNKLCPYNPYIALWENQEGYITVEEWRKQNPDWEKGIKRYPLVKNPQKVE